jgi:sialic acid synthase SpsE
MTNSLNIIAEVAQGFEGKPDLAFNLVKAAAVAGASGVKMQLVYADELATKDYKYFDLFKSLEMSDQVWIDLADLARAQNIGFYLDIFGSRSLKLAARVKVAGIKIHSTDMSNIGLLQEVANSSLNLVLLSISGCRSSEIDEALSILKDKSVVLLHGFQSYPTPIDANQISRVSFLIRKYENFKQEINFGFADHVPADDPMRFVLAATAVGMGVSVLEKHITLSKVMKFEDHESALNPDEFIEFVSNMKQCYEAVGKTDKNRTDFGMHESEENYRNNTRKHVVASCEIAAGTMIKPNMVSLKRTSSEQFIQDLREVYGSKATQDFKADQAITLNGIDGVRNEQ